MALTALKTIHPWIRLPFVVSAPMLGAATPKLAVNVSRAGGMGFLAGGTDAAKLDEMLDETTARLNHSPPRLKRRRGVLPIGVGFQLFNSPLDPLAEVISKHGPAAVWLFAPKEDKDVGRWSEKLRTVTNGQTQIWIQVNSVAEAVRSLHLANPDVLVAQGIDAGGHGQRQSASIVSLVPEMLDALRDLKRSDLPVFAAGGIVDGRGMAAALSLGSSGAVFGSRFLAAEEAGIAAGWKREILRTQDGGISTLHSTLCDRLKENYDWPARYDGRMIKNKGHTDEEAGMPEAENIKLYKEELTRGDNAWGPHGRMVAYAGSGVGLIKSVQPAESIVREVLSETRQILARSARSVGGVTSQSR